MALYAFIDTDGKILNTLYFDEEPEDITPFLEAQKSLLQNNNITAVNSNGSQLCNIGNFFNNGQFRPKQPFLSWIWDETKLVWRSPSLHPDIWPNGITDGDAGDYLWNEELQQWQAKT